MKYFLELFIAIALFFSGAACISAQVVMQKYLQVVLGGANAFVMTAVSLAVLAGLGLGSLVAGRALSLYRAPSAWWAATEFVCGAVALTYITAVERLHHFILSDLHGLFSDSIIVYYLYASGLIVVTTFSFAFFMGVNTPLVFEMLTRARERASSKIVIFIMFFNTAGAACGGLAAVMYMPECNLKDLLQYSAYAFALTGFIATAIFLKHLIMAPRPEILNQGVGKIEEYPGRLIGVPEAAFILFVIGFVGFSNEALLFRHYSFLHPYNYEIFGITLSVYLVFWTFGVGLAAMKRFDLPKALAGYLFSLVLFWILLTSEWISPLLGLIGLTPVGAFIVATVFSPALFSGLAFSAVYKHVKTLGAFEYALLYSANLCGLFLGGVATNILAPRYLISSIYVIIAGIALLVWLYFRCIRWSPTLANGSVPAWLLAALLLFEAGNSLDTGGYRFPHLRYHRGLAYAHLNKHKNWDGVVALEVTESWSGAVWVTTNHGSKSLWINGHYESPNFNKSQSGAFRTLQYTLPLIARNNKSVYIIGIAAGVSNGKIASLNDIDGTRRVTSVDYSNSLEWFNRKYREYNYDLLYRPNSTVKYFDGRLDLMRTNNRYDIIAQYSSGEKMPGASVLRSVEFFKIVKSRLTPKGMHISYSTSRATLGAMQQSFKNVFVVENQPIFIGTDLEYEELFDTEKFRSLVLEDSTLIKGILASQEKPPFIVKTPAIQVGRIVRDEDPVADYPGMISVGYFANEGNEIRYATPW
ncbi:MAG: hypothetical protein HQK86_12540 [Nitrospinae bacterium]|nr:hypothetical protein [Nitrospinota bacterium]MBF0633386.1 hypothetical protein [Nitrospinota bacterium]